MPVIGFHECAFAGGFRHLRAFHQGLGEGGFIEGQNVTIEFRWARGQYDRLPEMAADLVNRRVNVLTAVGGDPSPLAAKRATSDIPIVFGMGGDPVSDGLVESFNRPGGNVTGVTLMTNLMEPKRFSLLRELVPDVPLFGVLLNPNFPPAARQLQEIEEAARRIGQRIVVAKASTDEELDAAFAAFFQGACWRVASYGRPILRHAARSDRCFRGTKQVPAIYQFREYACGRTAELWHKRYRSLSPIWRLYRQYSQRLQSLRTCRCRRSRRC